jgi:hypothetical protein
MRRRSLQALLIVCAAFTAGAVLANGCAANDTTSFTGTGGKGGATGSSLTGTGGKGGSMSAGSMGGGGSDIILPDAGEDASDDVMVNPCGSKCGPKELCDTDHLGLDDNCDGTVDEGCSCQGGQVHFCFKGDPGYHGVPGCYDGTEKCTELGFWGTCSGGVHATPPDNCFNNDMTACHAISAAPFADVHLKSGTGMFSANAVLNSELWTVVCPAGVNPCPSVGGLNPPDLFKPLQSGEYTITYAKVVAGMGTQTCTYPLFVGAPGLRVELAWEHTDADNGVDLDLHLHEPVNTQPWGISPGSPHDCTWSNCVFDDFLPPQGFSSPKWFADPPAMPPTPVNWWLDQMPPANTCYYAPRGVGTEWQQLGMGCHNPRLDLDNIDCDFSIKNSDDPKFCAPENVNVDFPPNKQWFRIGVHYYSSHGLTYDVHPDVKIFCNGALTGQLGSAGYYKPQTPITFSPFDGDGITHRFWMVADVAFKKDQCSNMCIVKPIYSDGIQKTPFFTNDDAAVQTFAPAWPPPPP